MYQNRKIQYILSNKYKIPYEKKILKNIIKNFMMHYFSLFSEFKYDLKLPTKLQEALIYFIE